MNSSPSRPENDAATAANSSAREATTRRAREYLKRAAKLVDEAQRVRDGANRRHLLDLAETYRRAADQAATASSLDAYS